MCGICGFVDHGDRPEGDCARILKGMMDSIRHRGPDDEGSFHRSGAWLGHRRLSIIDVAGGHQPLFSEDGTIAVICNGEIYNHRDLRNRLQMDGHVFATRSDSEVIVHLWEEMGPAMLADLDGMFAIALWDSRSRTLLLARDRMGKKPLFWSLAGGGIVFGSELRPVMAHPDIPRRLSPEALYRYLTFDYVPTPMSILDGVRKVQPGGYVLFDDNGATEGRYHDLTPAGKVFDGSFDDAVGMIWDSLVRATGRRLESEVPLGVFLSGGLDSCSVLAAMAAQMDPTTISTFTIGFNDPSFDESAQARAVAGHFGTRHHEKILSGSEAVDLVSDMATIADEPLADYSILPSTLLARFAREHISVALSGDGGDELFYGYETFKADRWASVATKFLPAPVITDVLPALARMIPVTDRNMGLDYKVDRMIRGLKYDRYERHMAWVGGFDPIAVTGPLGVLSSDYSSALTHDAGDFWPDVKRILGDTEGMDPQKRLAILYMRLYMLDGVLVKVDRASMSAALEVRSPFLDTDMVDLALALPPGFNLRDGQTKALIRRMISGKMPAGITSLPKKGFGVPVASWLRQDLKGLVDVYLSQEFIKRQGIFNPVPIAEMIGAHTARRHNYRKELFSLLVFQLWHSHWLCN